MDLFPPRSALWILPSYLDLVPILGQLIGPCRVNSLHKCSHTILSLRTPRDIGQEAVRTRDTLLSNLLGPIGSRRGTHNHLTKNWLHQRQRQVLETSSSTCPCFCTTDWPGSASKLNNLHALLCFHTKNLINITFQDLLPGTTHQRCIFI